MTNEPLRGEPVPWRTGRPHPSTDNLAVISILLGAFVAVVPP